MAQIPKWAESLFLDALIWCEGQGYKVKIPELRWRKSKSHSRSSGHCDWRLGHITITEGTDRKDAQLVLLHETAHWVSKMKHNLLFWDLAWQLYHQFKVPVRYAFNREENFKQAQVAYRNIRKQK